MDAHVGGQLYDEALTGELGQGRTRILVTHHTQLVLPKAKYAVLLGEGTVLQARSINAPDEAGNPESIRDIGEVESPSEENGRVREDGRPNGEIPVRAMESKVDDGGLDMKGSKSKPKKFVEDEKGEVRGICIDS